MKQKGIEPGIIQVFRILALLRIGLVLLAFITGDYLTSFRPENFGLGPNRQGESDPLFFMVTTVLEMSILVAYLSIPWLQRKLGRFYLPIGLVFASIVLLSEPFIAFRFGQAWSADPFLYLLVIIIAWQYDFFWVFAFAATNIAIDVLIGPDEFFRRQLTDNPYVVNAFVYLIGKNISRTAAFMIIGFVVTQLSKAQRSQREELQEANKRLLLHNLTIEQLTISRERNRLSRELHDTLAHTLSALTVQLDAVTTIWSQIPPKAQKMLDTMLETTRSGLDETRRALHSLRASPLEDMGLTLAVNALAEDITSRYALRYTSQLDNQLGSLSPEVEQSFYRIAQEALENVGRHAQAEKVSVLLRKQNNELLLEISDDGVGVSEDDLQQQERLGIKGMQERAEHIGAKLTISGAPESGTTVRLVKDVKE